MERIYHIGDALKTASGNGHEIIVQLLIENDINVGEPNSCKMTALKMACENDHAIIVRLLIEEDVDVNEPNS